jgi:hypothetical protein
MLRALVLRRTERQRTQQLTAPKPGKQVYQGNSVLRKAVSLLKNRSQKYAPSMYKYICNQKSATQKQKGQPQTEDFFTNMNLC